MSTVKFESAMVQTATTIAIVMMLWHWPSVRTIPSKPTIAAAAAWSVEGTHYTAHASSP
jgi:hypothetical protein